MDGAPHMFFSEQLFNSLIALVFVLPLETFLNNLDIGTLISFLYALSIYLFVQVMPPIHWIFSFWGCVSRQLDFLCIPLHSLFTFFVVWTRHADAGFSLTEVCLYIWLY